MKITFLGTGDACDPIRRNTSLLVESKSRCVLFDCGFTSAQSYIACDPEVKVDTIWISHLHGDHLFGLAQLIVYLYMRGRTTPLTILCGTDCEEKIISIVDMAYPHLSSKIQFPLIFLAVSQDRIFEDHGLTWQSAAVDHGEGAFAIRITNEDQLSLFYSGDGKPTAASKSLMTSCNLVVHEAFSLFASKPTHSSIQECLAVASQLPIPRLALVHINREARDQFKASPLIFESPPATKLLLPEDGDICYL